jgi:hypothetical protein
MKTEEVLVVVQKINEKITEMFGEFSEPYYLDFCSNGYNSCVKFLGNRLWNSCDDERSFYIDKDDYQPLEEFLIREIKKIVNILENYSDLK